MGPLALSGAPTPAHAVLHLHQPSHHTLLSSAPGALSSTSKC